MNIFSLVFLFILTLSDSAASYTAEGTASFYADRLHGQRTASGERYDKKQFTAAHATLPFNTNVLVTNLKSGKTVVVRVNDRMARSRHNIIDISRAAALEIDLISNGSATVRLNEVKKEEQSNKSSDLSFQKQKPFPKLTHHEKATHSCRCSEI